MMQMGERLYNYEAPDGNPDVGAAWMNSNALLVRLEFANAPCDWRPPGVKIDLAAAQRLLDSARHARADAAADPEDTHDDAGNAAAKTLPAVGEQAMMMMRGATGAGARRRQ